MATHLSMRSGNPALTADTFRGERALPGVEAMTMSGTVNKTALALLLLLIGVDSSSITTLASVEFHAAIRK